MGIRVLLLPEMVQHAKQMLRLRCLSKAKHHFPSASHSSSSRSNNCDVPKGHFAVYVGKNEEDQCKMRFVVPIGYLKQPLFQDLLSRAEQEFGLDHPMAKLVIPCAIDDFVNITSSLNAIM